MNNVPHRSSALTGIRYVSLWEPSGYGEVARRQIVGLARAGVPVCWTPMRRGSPRHGSYAPDSSFRVNDPDLGPLCQASVNHNWTLVHTIPEYFPAWALEPGGGRLAGITVWETDRLPHSWPALLNRMDRIFVPCRFNRDTFARSGLRKPVHLLPYIRRPEVLPPRRDLPDIPSSHFVFYTINTWTARKALWLTLRAYLDTFTSRDPVTLVIKTTRDDLTRPRLVEGWYHSTRSAVRSILRGYPDPAAVVLMDREVPPADILDLHARGDCYLSLTRSEGWGMGAFDAASWGTPVIITGYGGQLDFLQPQAAGLVRHTLVPVHDPMGYPSFAPDQNWAEPDLAHARELLRAMVESPEKARDNARPIQEFIREAFNEKQVTENLIRDLERQP